MEGSESDAACAIREVFEEIGLNITKRLRSSEAIALAIRQHDSNGIKVREKERARERKSVPNCRCVVYWSAGMSVEEWVVSQWVDGLGFAAREKEPLFYCIVVSVLGCQYAGRLVRPCVDRLGFGASMCW